MYRYVCASDKQCMIALSEGLLVLGQLFHSTRVCKLTKISGSQYGVIMSNLHVSDHACCFTSGLCTLQVERTLIYIYNYLYSTILLLVHLCVCVCECGCVCVSVIFSKILPQINVQLRVLGRSLSLSTFFYTSLYEQKHFQR